MIAYDDALHRLLGTATPLPAERIDAANAIGRVLAAPLASPASLPPFDNSAMDGFAVRCGGAPVAAGVEFDVAGRSAAGDGIARAASGAWEIMTGAPLPHGLDAIVPVERVEVLACDDAGRATRIRVLEAVEPGRHVRRAGEDVAAGDVIAPPGAVVDAALCTLCAALGIASVDVRRRPRVAVVTTGRELVDDPARPLAPGEIRDSNTPFLRARLAAAGADVVATARVGDDIEDFLRTLAGLPEVDVVISTGAVSMGRFDFVPEALARYGARPLFHKVAIRPGKPVLAARLPGGALFVGLPGNPASTAVGLRFFVEPVLRAQLGLPPETPLRLPLAAPFASRVPLRLHLEARVGLDRDGRAGVEILGGQESFRIRPLLAANAWAVVPAKAEALPAGALVEVYGRGHLDPPTLA